ncbi:hypothetical protein TWF481_000447 [Arthrobotrys musiformis]|uniref:Mitochondrial thiamine pyrophosphate carrier 1 n=1 Tax=Arthrobotrys musiformis TaxID=47236 RepID=A0AAV9WPW5_9PEZI
MSASRHEGSTAAVSEIVAGVSAGFISTIVCHPLDLIKTRLQVHRHDTGQAWGGSVTVARQLLEEARATGRHPIKAFYRGISPNIIGNTASWGLYFLWYDQIKFRVAEYRGKQGQDLSSIDYLLSSGAAGVASAALTNPLWVVKTRMLTSGHRGPGAYRGLSQGLLDLAKKEGIRGYFRGFLPSLFGVLQAAIQFMTYEKLKIWRRSSRLESSIPDGHRQQQLSGSKQQEHKDAAYNGSSNREAIGHERSRDISGARQMSHQSTPALSNSDYMALSALSKVFAGALTYPYQVIRSRLQTHDAATVYSSARNAVFQTWKSQGIAGFYRGLGPNLVRVLPATCITFVVYENVRRIV